MRSTIERLVSALNDAPALRPVRIVATTDAVEFHLSGATEDQASQDRIKVERWLKENGAA